MPHSDGNQMKILRFDSVGGASGDMILASLIGLGADIEALRGQLASLAVEDFEIEVKPYSDHGLNGLQVFVDVKDSSRAAPRNLEDIRALLRASKLAGSVLAGAVRTLESLAEAEAEVHAAPPEKIHFHEIGCVDSIVDIVGACAALEMLDVQRVEVGPLPMGCGTVQCDHGILPVPAPATLALLKGHPVIQTDEPFELVTPTGAALLMSWLRRAENTPRYCDCAAESRASGITARAGAMGDGTRVIVKTSNGFGHRKLARRPNLLRATIWETARDERHGADRCVVLECNMDDTVPELLGSLTERLMAAGALDVFTTPIQMKKQRPGTLLTVLSRPGDKESFLDIIFAESTTFGIREYDSRRTVLDRRHIDVQTPYGTISVKIGSWKGKDITRAPEHGDCARCAAAHGVPVRAVYEAAIRAMAALNV